jgi:hypothetical protein
MTLSRMLTIAAAAVILIGVAGAAGATTLSGAMTADNVDYAWLGTSPNALGSPVASHGDWTSSSPVGPASLTPGVTNYLNIEAINQGGPGGLSFVLNLSDTGFHFANGRQTLTTDPANLPYFTATYNNANGSATSQPWVPATGPAIVASYPWGNVVGTANWADSIGGLNVCGYCTVDFTVPILSSAPEPATWALMLMGFGGLGAAMRGHRRAALAGA